MRAVCDDAATLQHMLDFEAALARAEAATGVIPKDAVEPIATACKAERLTSQSLRKRRPVPAISPFPWSKALTAQGGQARCGGRALRALGRDQPGRDRHGRHAEPARRYRRAARRPRPRDRRHLPTLARQHRHTAVVARTWLQHATADAVRAEACRNMPRRSHRSQARLQRLPRRRWRCSSAAPPARLRRSATRGWRCRRRWPASSKLPLPEAPWHTHRDRIAEAASVLAIIAGSCGKIARDISLMMQTDVGEAFEPAGEGRGGSSTMPHKRNPVAAASALAAADHGAQARRDHLCRAGAGSRAQRRPLACGMADLAGA